jgi:hypothetical protein
VADNTVQNGTSTVATDDVSGAHYQRVKLSKGRDGTAADSTTGAVVLSAAAANQDSTVIKASAGAVYSMVLTNINAAPRYVKLYNKATGPTSADTPVQVYAVPGNTAGAGMVVSMNGLDFAAGIALRMTTGAANNDANAVAANEVIANLEYV